MNEGRNLEDHEYPLVERRKALPDPCEKEKRVNLWTLIKDNIGKDLSRVCFPVYFNEPISSLQKCFEEYSYLLDKAYKYGEKGDSLMRVLHVAAFAISAYSSSEGRHRKPFNSLLGETYEADYPDKGVSFLSEKILVARTSFSGPVAGDISAKPKGYDPVAEAFLLWRKVKPPAALTKYNLTSFAATVNELGPELKEKLPPTDSRLRPDQRHLEIGEYDKADEEKLRLEKRQRMSRKLQESGWKPRWFQRDDTSGTFRYIGGYWEAREQRNWDGCPRIFR